MFTMLKKLAFHGRIYVQKLPGVRFFMFSPAISPAISPVSAIFLSQQVRFTNMFDHFLIFFVHFNSMLRASCKSHPFNFILQNLADRMISSHYQFIIFSAHVRVSGRYGNACFIHSQTSVGYSAQQLPRFTG